MPTYDEDALVDTSAVVYSKTGIRLLKYIKTVFGNDVLGKLKAGKLIVWFNGRPIEYDKKKFRDHRVKEHTNVNVKCNYIQLEVGDNFETEGNHPFFF